MQGFFFYEYSFVFSELFINSLLLLLYFNQHFYLLSLCQFNRKCRSPGNEVTILNIEGGKSGLNQLHTEIKAKIAFFFEILCRLLLCYHSC